MRLRHGTVAAARPRDAKKEKARIARAFSQQHRNDAQTLNSDCDCKSLNERLTMLLH